MVHFSIALLICILATIRALTWTALGISGGDGLGGGAADAVALGSRPYGSGTDCPVGRWHPKRLGYDGMVRDAIERSQSHDTGDSAPQL